MAVALLAMLALGAQAQITRAARVELHNSSRIVQIGPEIYTTQDPEKKLNYQAIVVRHQNNLRGTRHDSHILNLGLRGVPTWMVFTVTNNSTNEDWVLHFGRLPEGRLGFAHKLFVRNDTRGEVYTRGLGETDSDEAPTENMQGAALPVKISAGKTELFVMYIEPESAFANTLTPSLMTESAYLNLLRFGHFFPIIAALFFIGTMGAFLAISLMRQNPEFMLFAVYYLINASLLFLIDNSFYMPISIGGEMLTALYAMNILAGLAITKFLLNVTYEDQTENLVILATGAFTIIVMIFNLILYSEGGLLDEILVFFPSAIGMFILGGLSFSQGQRGKYAGHYYASAWMLGLAGHVLTGLSAAGLINVNSLFLNAYWLFLLPQAAFFITGTAKKIRMSEEEQRHLRARESRAERSQVRLQQSKESADQARLLRVIERERELMAELREREMQRTEEMRRAKEMADEANRAKSAFLAVVSHEIRTPMTGLLGMVRLLNDTKLSKDQHDYLIAMQKSGDTMMALLNDILDFEKIQSGNMDIEAIDFDLPKLVYGVVTLMSGHAADKKIFLRADIPENFPNFLLGDPTRLRQVLLNLVSNAIKFTHEGGVTIRLRATPYEKKDDAAPGDYEIYFSVEDSGIGVSEEAQQNLFSPFAQADKTVARKYGGTGLGLAICKSLIDAMGATIRVTSEQGAGSTFFFSLLMEKGHEDETEEAETARRITHELPPMRILIIEDNEMNRRVLQGFLERDGHDVVLSTSGEEGVEAARSQRFDVIFTDINLSGMNGMETTKVFRSMKNNNTAGTPVIAITGNVAPEDVKSYYAAGLNGFIGKPIDPEKLRGVLIKVNSNTLDNPVQIPEEEANTEHVQQDETLAQKISGREAIYDDNIAPIHRYISELTTDANAGNVFDGLDDLNDDFDSFAEAEQSFADETSKLETAAYIEAHEQAADIKPAKPVEIANGTFDKMMLQGLMDGLGKEQFADLIKSFIEKADELVAALEWLKQNPDIAAVRDRAHELKGMAANFGVTGLADIAAVIERAARANEQDKALAEIEKLPGENQRAKDAIAQWLDKSA